MPDPAPANIPIPAENSRARRWRAGIVEFFSGYFWFIFKNVIGWLFIMLSVPVGFTVPGPGGIPLFLIGFALVTFPGKRKLTSRVMRGRGLPIETEIFTFLTAFFAILGTAVLMWFIADWVSAALQTIHLNPQQRDATVASIIAGLLVMGLFALGMTWLVMRLSLHVLNYILRGMPIIRRKIRPWLRKKGFNLLPSRRKRAAENGEAAPPMSDEILEIDVRHQNRIRAAGGTAFLWAKRAAGVAITIGIFYFILRPIREKWPLVKPRLMELSVADFLLASLMFAVFLFTFRAMIWRKILVAFGYRLPLAPAVRIWSTSELARYLPGAIWQVVGRVYLIRPYGVTGAICSVTQILELTIFLLANLIVAVACLGYFGFKHLEGHAWWWLVAASVLLPLLLLLLYTKIFYGLANAILARFGKPKIEKRVRGRALPGMLAWNVFGLIWQALALFVLMREPLNLKIDWLWTLAGAYCLAWCAGFLAFWAPGGLGVRELVFIGAMKMIAPNIVKSTEGFDAVLALLSVLTRLWATTGEVILASIAYAIDYRGALGRPDAPGRVPIEPPSHGPLIPSPGAPGKG
ncbi:MAG TPA: lysylphosphatidylglycerol synthase domain-containing protein [Tepidisphaeraceae bacterium]|jgi:hypothetical protein